MAGKVKIICEEKISPIIEEMGYEVVDIEYCKKSDGMNLIFYIDNEEGVKIEDCEKVSKVIDPILDEINPTDDKSYILSVSSPGIDRPLHTNRDFKRNIGHEILITTFSKIDGSKKFEGKLISFDENQVTIEQNKQQLIFERDKIAHVEPLIKF